MHSGPKEIKQNKSFWSKYDISKCWCNLKNKDTIIKNLTPSNLFVQVLSNLPHWVRGKQLTPRQPCLSKEPVCCNRFVKITSFRSKEINVKVFLAAFSDAFWSQGVHTEQIFFGQNMTSQNAGVTLKIRTQSLKSNS